MDTAVYDPNCRACARLATFLDTVHAQHPRYVCRPVPPFGSDAAQVMVVGLAPGMHGANATGRPFTGDWCSDLLYGTLHAHGFATRPQSISRDDDQRLINCRLTNAVKCLPPGNKPTLEEVKTCSRFLANEIAELQPQIIVCLGAVAHDAVVRCLAYGDPSIKRSQIKFGHGREHVVGRVRLIDSYHPSRYNTNTGRLTPEMFTQIFTRVRELVDGL